nr:hypothetical protein [Tanacetum cinerariifolium]
MILLLVGDDEITLFTREYARLSLNFVRSHVLTIANCGDCVVTGVNDKRYAITVAFVWSSVSVNVAEQSFQAFKKPDSLGASME